MLDSTGRNTTNQNMDLLGTKQVGLFIKDTLAFFGLGAANCLFPKDKSGVSLFFPSQSGQLREVSCWPHFRCQDQFNGRWVGLGLQIGLFDKALLKHSYSHGRSTRCSGWSPRRHGQAWAPMLVWPQSWTSLGKLPNWSAPWFLSSVWRGCSCRLHEVTRRITYVAPGDVKNGASSSSLGIHNGRHCGGSWRRW